MLDVEHIAEHLYTKGQPDPDLVIRTSRGAAARRLPALAERAERVLLLRGLLARLPPRRLPARRPRLRRSASGASAPDPRPTAVRVRSRHPPFTPAGRACRPVNRRSGRRTYRCGHRRVGKPVDPGGRFVILHDGSTGGRHSGLQRRPGPCSRARTGAPSARAGPQGDDRGRNAQPSIEHRELHRRTPYLRARHQRPAGRPAALRKFEEHEVVLPVVVITELEGKRHHPELGYFARSALRMLDELRVSNGRLDEPVPVGETGGTVRVELNHTDADSLPSGFRLGDNDTRILAVARNLANEGHQVTLVSKDLPLRIKASAVGLDAEEYRGRAGPRVRLGLDRHGRARGQPRSTSTSCTTSGAVDLDEARDLPCHTGLVLLSERGSALGRVHGRQAGAPGARRPGGVRHPRPQRRAADRARPAARPRGRHRLARRPGRHRQVRAGALRRPRGGAGAAASTRRSSCSGRCSRSAARSSATCPAASRRRCRPGARPSSTRSARSPAPTWSTRCSTAGCSRCCR